MEVGTRSTDSSMDEWLEVCVVDLLQLLIYIQFLYAGIDVICYVFFFFGGLRAQLSPSQRRRSRLKADSEPQVQALVAHVRDF